MHLDKSCLSPDAAAVADDDDDDGDGDGDGDGTVVKIDDFCEFALFQIAAICQLFCLQI